METKRDIFTARLKQEITQLKVMSAVQFYTAVVATLF